MRNKAFKKITSYFLIISMVLLSCSSVFATMTTTSATPIVITTPAMIVATAGDLQINLIWSPVTGATYYNVYQSLDDLTYNLISTPATTSYDVTGLTNGKMYYFKISAANTASESTYSYVVSETPSMDPLQ